MVTPPSQTIVCVGTSDGSVYALHNHDGSQIWKFQFDPAAISVPALNKNVVCVSTVSGVLYALQKSSGSLLWHQSLLRSSSPPTLTSEQAYVCTDNAVSTFHLENGSQQWQRHIHQLAPIKPVIVGDRLYVRSTRGSIYALQVNDGSILWQFDTGEEMLLPLAVSEEHVCVRRPDGMLFLLRTSDGSPIWQRATDYFSPFDPAIIHNVIYLDFSKGLEALQTDDGASLWRFSSPLSITCPVKMIGETVYASAGENNRFAVFALQARNGTLRWQRQITCSDGGISSPVAGNDIIYVSITSKCGSYALDSQNGSVHWHTFNDMRLTMPVVG